MSQAENSKLIMTGEELSAALERLAGEILELHPCKDDLAIVGIQRRGVYLARRLKTILEARLGRKLPDGVLDINLYRDDWTTLGQHPVVGPTRLNFDLNAKDLILVDDVLFTGRTIRAALEALVDFGRPRKVELLVLVDRGHRELPIQPDYVGRVLATRRAEQVDVLLSELDGRDEVLVREKV